MRDTSHGFDRLQELLLAMHTGEEVHPAYVAEATGLSEHVCRQVLEGLTRAGLMADRADGRFVRRTLDFMAS